MAMSSTGRGEGEPIIEMNTTPLIDVLLVLLIMFIITLPLMTHSRMLQMSGGQPARLAKVPEVVRVAIDFDGVVLWNGVPVEMGELERYFAAEAGKAEQPDVQISPDKRARYDTVARVLAIAQRAGMKRIGVDSHFDTAI